jgi:hypothetical protein
VIIPSSCRALVAAIAACAALGGALVALHYHHLGLTLTHYDARGHLVVARRIFDSLTPGWQQIGAVWLPLPHLLNAVPVQVDAFYRTGASGVAISIISFTIATGAIAWIVAALTASPWAAAAAAVVFALNPNVLYLQSTPMTEPLLTGLTLLAVALLMAWCGQGDPDSGRQGGVRPPDLPAGVGSAFSRIRHATRAPAGTPARGRITGATVGWALALACLTRYEAWPVALSALAAAVWVRWRTGEDVRRAFVRVSRVGLYPAVAILGFVVFSRVVVGEWFVASGFFVPDNPAAGDPYLALAEIVWGARALSGLGLMIVAAAGAISLVMTALLDRHRAVFVVPVALMTTAALPWLAFIEGHPYRIRYAVPLIAAQAVCAGVLTGLWKRWRIAAPVALLLLAGLELRPLDASAPMIVEAQWDRPNVAARQHVTDCLSQSYRGDTVMASMGSLGHYMQELSREGFRIRDFLHEGNGDIWLGALTEPRPFAGWMLVEEKAEGGDMLAVHARENPRFLDGFARICDGAGVALYRRQPTPAHELEAVSKTVAAGSRWIPHMGVDTAPRNGR